MAPPRKLPDDDTFRRLHRRGVPHVEIAAMYDVTENTVWRTARRLGLTTDRPDYGELLPWSVVAEHRYSTPAECLRLEGRRRRNLAEGKSEFEGFGQGKVAMLQNFLARLGPRGRGGVVVDYDPHCPPNDLSPIHGGFYARPWERRDGESIIRRPKMQRNARTGQRVAKRAG